MPRRQDESSHHTAQYSMYFHETTWSRINALYAGLAEQAPGGPYPYRGRPIGGVAMVCYVLLFHSNKSSLVKSGRS